jgi:hypothetical protein
MLRVTELMEAAINLAVNEFGSFLTSRHCKIKFLPMSAKATSPTTRSSIFSFLFTLAVNQNQQNGI